MNEASVIMVVTWFTWPGDDVTVNNVDSTVDRFAVDGEAAGKCLHSGPTEVEDCSLPPPNMAATKTGEQGKVWFSDL